MKIRCGKRCGGRRSIIAAKFQPFASEILAPNWMPPRYVICCNNNKIDDRLRLQFVLHAKILI